jgi:hypothetical protein
MTKRQSENENLRTDNKMAKRRKEKTPNDLQNTERK